MSISKQLFFALLLSFSLLGCKKETIQESPTCGCDSEPVRVIDSNQPLIGEMYYLKEGEYRSYFTNHFWIAFTYPECGNCKDGFILCDSDFLADHFQDLYDLPETDPILVEFSGDVMTPCIFPTAWVSDISFYRLNNYQIKRIDSN